MTAIADANAIAALPLPPPNPLPYRQRLADVRDTAEGVRRLCAAGGPVTSVTLAYDGWHHWFVSSPRRTRRWRVATEHRSIRSRR
jgi:hypothetical protein